MYTKQYRVVETLWNGTQYTYDFDTEEGAQGLVDELVEWELKDKAWQYRSDYKIEERQVIKGVKGHSIR